MRQPSVIIDLGVGVAIALRSGREQPQAVGDHN
jgi:hypothetical protein